ncbi:hypothetical protein ACOME3_006816 [Neoechinorhynchus agilis]
MKELFRVTQSLKTEIVLDGNIWDDLEHEMNSIEEDEKQYSGRFYFYQNQNRSDSFPNQVLLVLCSTKLFNPHELCLKLYENQDIKCCSSIEKLQPIDFICKVKGQDHLNEIIKSRLKDYEGFGPEEKYFVDLAVTNNDSIHRSDLYAEVTLALNNRFKRTNHFGECHFCVMVRVYHRFFCFSILRNYGKFARFNFALYKQKKIAL